MESITSAREDYLRLICDVQFFFVLLYLFRG